MAIRNNSFTRDDGSDRAERLELLSANIDTYSAELGIDGDLLTWAEGASAVWESCRATADVEHGEMNDAFEDFHLYVKESSDYYATAKSMLINILREYEEPLNDFMERYDLKGQSPRRYKKLVAKIDGWLIEDARLRALVPPDGRVVPESVITELTLRRDKMNVLYQNAYSNKEKSGTVHDRMIRIFREDSYKLSILFDTCRLHWGNEAPKLCLLGFVPASEVWTSGAPLPAPEHLAHDPATDIFSWDGVDNAEGYELQYAVDKRSPNWSECYRGEEISVVFRPEESGNYLFRVRAYEKKVGKWSEVLSVSYVG